MTPNQPARPPRADERTFFDRFASSVSTVGSRPTFFAFCLLLVGIWLVEGIVRIVIGGGLHAFLDDKYQLQINTTTTIITFLMVALLQNAQQRFENSTNAKMNAMADALADFMEVAAEDMTDDRCGDLNSHAAELRRAVGAEARVGA